MSVARRRLHVVYGLALILLFAAGHSWYAWQAAALGLGLGSDQLNIGVMTLKLHQPALYQNDYVFADPDFFSFYTPSFLNLAGWLADVVGDYPQGLALLLLPVIILYTSGMWLLLASFMRRRWLALLIAMASAYLAETLGGTLWGAAALRVMIPRTLLLSLIPWWVWLWLRWRILGRWYRLPLLGLLLGLAANLHPVSGLMLAQLFVLTELWWGRTEWRQVRFWLMFGLTISLLLLGVWPTAGNFIRHSGLAEAASTSEDFGLFRQVMHFSFSTLFPFHSTRLQTWLGPAGQTALVIFQLALLAAVGLAAGLDPTGLPQPDGSFPTRRVGGDLSGWELWSALLVLVQLPALFFITDGSSPILLLLLAAYGLTLLLRPNWLTSGPLDRWAIFVLTAAVSLTLVGSFLLEWIWGRWEWWALTSLVGEQARLAKFVYLPLYLLAGRWLDWLLGRLDASRRSSQLLVGGLALLLAVHRPVALILLALWITLFLLVRRERPVWLGAALFLALSITALALGLLWSITSAQLAWLTLFGSAVLYYWLRPPGRRARRHYGVLFAGLFLAVMLWRSTGPPLAARLVPNRYAAAQAEQQARLDAQALYAWARTATDPDAVFYTGAFEFRYYAQRAITHSTKDWGTAYYRREGLVAMAQRWQRLTQAYGDETLLLARAEEVGVDYLYLEQGSPLSIDRTVVYENDSFVVYDLQP